MLRLLFLATTAIGQLVMKPVNNNNICVMYPKSRASEVNETVYEPFKSYSQVYIKFSEYDDTTDGKNVLKILNQIDISNCPMLAVYIVDSGMDFISFLSSQNECQEFEARKKHYIKLDVEKEYFTYARDLKYCPLSNDLIGIYCDSQLDGTYHEIQPTGQSYYDITDIPEFTEMGYVFYSTQSFYICERVSSNEFMPVYYFYNNQAPDGTITRAVNWGNAWSNFKKVAQMIYKILDIFFGRKNLEPRA
ncbi:VP7 [Rotavirus G chicken/03V0567/DEU/2003]|uniref:Outer capsid glycoprotein VP7 n=1 Tax=Rotavirus G chicken/03V0567/DEU/2003 TaxID=994995 RepID=M4H2P6_9REOV|nr:VP7 [Rotavirus G chicken/03V0567/DEU/2003]AFL91896.1 VP7 [Rotavirus G chicken/03V0567/DEU/2003]